jgi:hypothetical protein
MVKVRQFFVLSLVGTLALACSSTAGSVVPPSQQDASMVLEDAGTKTDSQVLDASSPASEILGTLAGSCGEIRAELAAAGPSVKVDALTFITGESYDKAFLSEGGDILFDTPNAGGSSTESEVMSFEVLHACDGARLLKTETQIKYTAPQAGQPSSITDLLVEIDGKKVGVSVTRAYKPANQGLQTDAELQALLEKKLEGVNVSSKRVLPEDRWVKQILHVFAATQASVEAALRVLPKIAPATRADTIVFITKTTGGGFVYCNPDPPLGRECP